MHCSHRTMLFKIQDILSNLTHIFENQFFVCLVLSFKYENIRSTGQKQNRNSCIPLHMREERLCPVLQGNIPPTCHQRTNAWCSKSRWNVHHTLHPTLWLYVICPRRQRLAPSLHYNTIGFVLESTWYFYQTSIFFMRTEVHSGRSEPLLWNHDQNECIW